MPAKTEIVVPVADSDQSTGITLEKNDGITTTVVNKKDSSNNSFITGNRISLDSVVQQALPFSKPDSSAIIKNNLLLPSFDSIPLPPLIKPKGVKGITDNDYRIQENKKDSGKRGG